MDTAKTTHISLCSGYGGIDLGLRRVVPNLRTVAYAEIEAFACENLLARMEGGQLDAAPIWSDLKSFPWKEFSGLVDILSGGYPCQPFSAAGKRLGTQDPRHLWPYIADGIRLLRPRCCFFENVEGHISMGLSSVISDLEELGYRTTWGIFSAAEVGAPHQRKRVFILAHNQRERVEELGRWIATRTQQHPVGDDGSNAWPSRPGEQQYGWEPPRVVADSHRIDRSAQAEGREHDRQARPAGEELGDTDHGRQPSGIDTGGCTEASGGGQGDVEQAESGQTQPPLGGDADGPAGRLDYAELCISCDNRTDELRLLGNGVVPATAAQAFATLIHELTTDTAPSREGEQTPTHQQTNL